MRPRLSQWQHSGTAKLWLLVVALAATCTAFAQGASEAVLGYSNNTSAYVTTTVGWTFQTTQTVTVTELGCFANVFLNNPLVTAIQVGLWDESGTLLASNSVSTTSALLDRTRYGPITPVALEPGPVYHLGVYYSGGGIGVDIAGVLAQGSVSMSPGVQLRAAAYAQAGFAFPAEQPALDGSLFAGPNFLFQALPWLNIQPWPTNRVRLSWPTAYPGYTLQSELGLSGTWASAGLTVTTVTNEFVAFDNIGSVPKYYRLVK